MQNRLAVNESRMLDDYRLEMTEMERMKGKSTEGWGDIRVIHPVSKAQLHRR